MRINKYIAAAGVVSRRKADDLVKSGNVKVNGVTQSEPGMDILDGDVVAVNGKVISPTKKIEYIVLNKPIGYITSVDDEQNRPIVMDLVADIDARIFPIGRLDYNTSGLLIMTNDGDMAYKLTHPSQHVFKTYVALVSGILSGEKMYKLKTGVDIGGYITKPANVKIIKGTSKSTLVEIQIAEGKNRQVRKMFSAVGNPVQELERTAIGEIRLGRLKTGDYRKLKKEEIEYLKNC